MKLICVTEGDAGTHRTMPEIRGSNLAQVRRNELRKSAKVMGAQEVECLGLPDGGLANVARGELESVLAQKIDEFQPHVLVTLGIDGVYGHTDHVVLTQAVMDVCRRPEFSNTRLLHCAFPEGLFRASLQNPEKKRARSLLDSGVELKDLGLSRDVCDVIVDISQYAPTKRLCIEAHESQLLEAKAESFLLPGLHSHLLLESGFSMSRDHLWPLVQAR